MNYIETSSLNGENVEKAVEKLVLNIIKRSA